MRKNNKYYNLKSIETFNANYNIIISDNLPNRYYINTYIDIIKKWFYNKEQTAILFTKENISNIISLLTIFNMLRKDIRKITNNIWDCILLYNHKWYMGRYDDILKKHILSDEPFAYYIFLDEFLFNDYSKVNNIIFHNFIDYNSHNKNDFHKFMKIVLEIIRDRNDIKIFMFGNIKDYKDNNKSLYINEYFKLMDIQDIDLIKQNETYVYTKPLKMIIQYK